MDKKKGALDKAVMIVIKGSKEAKEKKGEEKEMPEKESAECCPHCGKEI